MTTQTENIWAAWNSLPDRHPAPAKQIARDLNLSTAEVAAVVFPAEHFGAWDDSQEPDADADGVFRPEPILDVLDRPVTVMPAPAGFGPGVIVSLEGYQFVFAPLQARRLAVAIDIEADIADPAV